NIQNNETVEAEGAADDPVYQLFTEIQAEIARLKKRPFRDVGSVHVWLTGTGLPLLRDVAYRLFENSEAVDELFDRSDEGSEEGTQFTVEDAKKFDLVLQYAKGVAAASLEQVSTDEAKAQLQQVIQLAEACLKAVEENTIEASGDEEQEE